MKSKFLGVIDQNKTQLIKQKRWLWVCVFIVIAQSCTIMHLSNQHTTVIVPQFANQEYKIVSNQVNPEYLMALARGDVSTFFNVSPTNIQFLTNEFLTRLMPSYYNEEFEKLQDRVKTIKDGNASYSFFPDPNMIEVKGEHVTVGGTRIMYVNGNVVDHGLLSVAIDYSISNSFVYIKSWNWNYESQNKHQA